MEIHKHRINKSDPSTSQYWDHFQNTPELLAEIEFVEGIAIQESKRARVREEE